ncbi:MAG: Lrp/AsnC family transcriptional regulator [Candidatus Aenigmatarchaeota archaeon]
MIGMLDKKDEMIIKVLEKYGRMSSRKIAMKTNLPISTVHRRIRCLEKNGVIKGYMAVVNHEKIQKITVLFFVNVDEINGCSKYIPIESVKNELKKMDEVYEIFDIKGINWDIVVKARIEKLSDLNFLMENIRKIRGIEEVTCAIVSEEILTPTIQ